MTNQQAIYLLNNLRAFAEEDDDPAIDMAIEALSDPHDCAGCKYEEVWAEACEKCGRPMVDNYVKEADE